MGKAVPKGIKSRALVLMETYPTSFGIDFEKNKQFIQSLSVPFFKKERNVMAGYITRKMKQSMQAS